MDGSKEFWPSLANEAAYILDLLASSPDADDTMLLIIAIGRIEKLLNPKRLPFPDRERQSHGGDAELCRGWRKIRSTVDALIRTLHLEPICEDQVIEWGTVNGTKLPSLPSDIPRNWIESLNSGVRIIRGRLQQQPASMQRGKPWHVCDDCLEPLAGELFSLSQRFQIHFDVAKRDRLDNEYREIQEQTAYCDDRLTVAQRECRGELLKLMAAQKEPPRPFDVDMIYRKYNIDLAVDWLKFCVSVDYANDFKRTLQQAQKRFSSLDFKACQIINGDLGKETTIQGRYAIQRLVDRHYELLREHFPNHESHPDRDQMPDEMRAFEVEILDEYTIVEQEFRKTVEYLRRVSVLVRSKLSKAHTQAVLPAHPAASQPTRPTPAGRKVATDDYETRKRVAERWDSFNGDYKALGYNRCTWPHFAAWASEQFDDMPSDDHEVLKRMADAYRKTPMPRNLV